ncbi:MAG: hypothetical protein B6U72_05990 [Candidatus Altiarchaeales archaeon ex4484_2]|nr:MAG: hypothetical protein B6U72_05990 [Candidatus Altiarchaeales archaeon ex4484_2]
MKKTIILFLVASLLAAAGAQQNAIIYGYVLDEKTGAPLDKVVVEIFASDDPSRAIVSRYTDSRGFFNASVQGNRNYEIYVRLGDKNPKQSVYVTGGAIQEVRFVVSMETISEQNIIEQPYFLVFAVIAVLVIGVILFDEVYMRRRKISALETDKEKLKNRIESTVELDEVSTLEKKRDRIELMIKMAQLKFHKRKLDDESFREIVRDKQKDLIEIEARLSELKKTKGNG